MCSPSGGTFRRLASLFDQIALFSIAGLAMSLALAFTYDLQIASQWP